jgi:hypothetical protein
MQTLVTIVMIVKTYLIAVELRDNMKENSPEAIGLATFSNSKSIQVRLASKRRGGIYCANNKVSSTYVP